jgi:membrane protease YdiL (CAAX protease family)
MRALIARYPVLIFVLFALVYQAGIVGSVKLMLPDGGHLHEHDSAWMVFRMRVFGPLIFAVGITGYLEGWRGIRHLFSGFFRWRVGPGWYAWAIGWKFLFTFSGVAFAVSVGWCEWPGWIVGNVLSGDHRNLLALISTLPFIFGIAFVEETAWMKFCVTRLQVRWSALHSCVIVGLAWGLWYLPMLLLGEGVPDGYPWPVFLLSMLALTVLLGWTFNMTKSGAILWIMQVVSNSAFFLLPVLPGWWNGDAVYINAFVAVNALAAVVVVAVFGSKELSNSQRARWSPQQDGWRGSSSENDRPPRLVKWRSSSTNHEHRRRHGHHEQVLHDRDRAHGQVEAGAQTGA